MSTVHFYCVLCGTALETSSESQHDLLKCRGCARNVPVPRRADATGDFRRYAHVFPPDVLELLVKFQCTACGAVLYADARCEGREVVCSSCRVRTGIPCWSNLLDGPRFAEAGAITRMRSNRSAARGEAPMLSPEEIEFLRGPRSDKPEAGA